MKHEDGGPAFPQHQWSTGAGIFGMSLRDYFAAKAMTGIMSNPDHAESTQDNARGAEAVAKHAYLVADEMLAVRKTN